MTDAQLSRLPKYVRTYIADLSRQLYYALEELDRTKAAHALLVDKKHWYTIPGPCPQEAKEDPLVERCLFVLHHNGANKVATLYPGDVCLIGRKDQ